MTAVKEEEQVGLCSTLAGAKYNTQLVSRFTGRGKDE
jgi:hypothetical protein